MEAVGAEAAFMAGAASKAFFALIDSLAAVNVEQTNVPDHVA